MFLQYQLGDRKSVKMWLDIVFIRFQSFQLFKLGYTDLYVYLLILLQSIYGLSDVVTWDVSFISVNSVEYQ